MAETEHSLMSKFLQEDYDLTEECKELVRTLPIEKGWIRTYLHQYEGFWYATKPLQGVLSCQKHFEALDSDILLVTTPKSGTTWLKAWTFALLNRKKYPDIHNNHPLLTSNPHDLVPFLESNLYRDHKDFVPYLQSLSPPRLLSTHLPYVSLPKSVKELNCKVVYLCRDPKDTFVSLWHFTNKLRPAAGRGTLALEEAFEKFCSGVTLFGPFWEHLLGYWKESLERKPEKFLFLRYEEMKMRPGFCLKKLAEFLECPFSREEESTGVVSDILNLCSFDKLSNLEVNKVGKLSTGAENNAFFRSGQVGDWKNILTIEMIERLNTITDQKLAEHGFSFSD